MLLPALQLIVQHRALQRKGRSRTNALQQLGRRSKQATWYAHPGPFCTTYYLQMNADGETVTLGVAFAAKLLPLLADSAAANLSTQGSLQAWLNQHKGHPAIASALLHSGWVHRSERNASNAAALAEELDAMIDEAESSSDSAAAGQLVSMFGLGSIDGKAGYVLSRAEGALAPLVDRLAAQPQHPLHGFSAQQLNRLSRYNIGDESSITDAAALQKVSLRVAALAKQHECEDQAHRRGCATAGLEAHQAQRHGAAEANWAQLFAAITTAVSQLPALQQAAMLTEPTSLTQLPAPVRAALETPAARAFMGNYAPARFLEYALQRGDTFQADLYSMLSSAKQQAEARLSAAERAALPAAAAEEQKKAAGYHANRTAAAAANRTEFLGLLKAAVDSLPADVKASLPTKIANLRDLPLEVNAALGMVPACKQLAKQLGKPVQAVKPACIGSYANANAFFCRQPAQCTSFEKDVSAMLRTAKQQGEAELSERPAKRRKGSS